MDPLLNAYQHRRSNNNPTLMPYNINNNSCGENRIFFETFFTGWLIRQKNYLDQLMSAGKNFQNISEMELRSLVFQILTHYQQYYTAKVTAARKDVFVMFAPPWFSSYELTYLWITGFKPSLAFKILDKSVVNQDKLSDEQLEALCRLRVQTKAAERVLNNEMARVQESLALPPLVALRINPAGRRVDGGETVDAAMQTVTKEMEILVESADFLRITTAMKIVEILSPVQSVRFLAAATQLQVNIRMLGLQRDAERGGRSITGSAQE